MLDDAWSSVSKFFHDFSKEFSKVDVLKDVASRPSQHATRWRDRLRDKYLQWVLDSQTVRINLPVPAQHDLQYYASLAFLLQQITSCCNNVDSITSCPFSTLICSVPAIVFTTPGGVSLQRFCVNPYYVINKRQYYRLLTGQVLHFDDTHLFNNLSVLIPACMYLETTQPSTAFLWDALFAVCCPPTLYVSVSWLLKHMKVDDSLYYQSFSVGASAVGYALKVIQGYAVDSTTTGSHERFTWGVNFVIGCVVLPNASVTGHLCGVAAGLIHVHLLKPGLQKLGLAPAAWNTNHNVNRDRRKGWVADVLGHMCFAGAGVLLCLWIRKQK